MTRFGSHSHPKTAHPSPIPLLVIALVVVYGAGVANANPLDQFGFGARASAMGGAYTSLADDSSANYYNPAGLAQGEDLRFDLGYIYAQPKLRFDNGDANVDRVSGIQGGLVLPGELLGVRFGVGIGLLVLDDRVTRVRSLPQQQPRFVIFDNRVQRLFIAASLAVETFENLYVGGGLNFFSDSFVNLDMTGTVSILDEERTLLQAAVQGDLQSARYPTLGILYAPDAPWSIGLAFRDEFFLRLRLSTEVAGQIVIDSDPDAPLVLVEEGRFFLQSRNANLFTPRSLVLGGSYQVGQVTLSGDLGWHQWSTFPAPTSAVDIELELEGLDFSIPPLDSVEAPEFSDIFVPRVGVEGRVVESDHVALDLRGGYFFEDSPAPDQPGRTNYADAPKHGLSVGLGLALSELTAIFPKPLELDLSVLYVHMNERTYLKSDPADLIGDYSVRGHILSGSVLLGINL